MNLMNIAVSVCAVWLLILTVLVPICDAYQIGKPRVPYTPDLWLGNLVLLFAPLVVVLGRVFQWW